MWRLYAEDAGAKIRHDAYYRCLARTLAPGSAVLADHLRTVHLRESVVLGPANDWLAELFARENHDQLVAGLLDAQPRARGEGNREAAKRRLADAELKLRRYRAAIEAGIDPAALVEATNEARTRNAWRRSGAATQKVGEAKARGLAR